ncbi:MAG: carbon starvation CstA family protein, partial [Thermodesulfobacteriota bacterium]|nr:carbon starvation CstA family protein [Thermodesulfobacteriota bacterium]
MNSLLLFSIMIAGYLTAYHTYGKFLARRIFRINPKAVCPSTALRDDHDFVPTSRHILFGHHFKSIAGLGPIVGPAIAV